MLIMMNQHNLRQKVGRCHCVCSEHFGSHSDYNFFSDVCSGLPRDQLPVCQVWAQQGLLLDAGFNTGWWFQWSVSIVWVTHIHETLLVGCWLREHHYDCWWRENYFPNQMINVFGLYWGLFFFSAFGELVLAGVFAEVIFLNCTPITHHKNRQNHTKTCNHLTMHFSGTGPTTSPTCPAALLALPCGMLRLVNFPPIFTWTMTESSIDLRQGQLG